MQRYREMRLLTFPAGSGKTEQVVSHSKSPAELKSLC